MWLCPGMSCQLKEFIFGEKTVALFIPKKLRVRSFPVVPRTTGIAKSDTKSLQVVQGHSVGIHVIPWVRFDFIALSYPLTETAAS